MSLTKDGQIMDDVENRLLKRFTVLKNLDYYIKESVYYRSFSDDIKLNRSSILWNYEEDSGSISIYEDSI